MTAARCAWLILVALLPLRQMRSQSPLRLRGGSIEVVIDGSRQPPGDLIRVRPICLAIDEPVTAVIAIRPMILTERNGRTIPIEIEGNRNFEVRSDARFGPSPGKPFVDIVVPFARIGLPPGEHRLLYRVTAALGDQTQFVQYSKPEPVLVGRPRTISADEIEYQTRTEQITRTCELFEGGVRKRHLLADTVEIKVPVARSTGRTATVPEGYVRSDTWKGQDWNDPRVDRSLTTVSKRRIVHWATTRAVKTNVANPRGPADFADFSDGQLRQGTVEVAIPIDHQAGDEVVEEGFFVGRSRAYRVAAWNNLRAAQFFGLLAGEYSRHDVLILVHGYNTSFQFAIFKAAQFATDIGFVGKVVSFAWASKNAASGFAADLEESRLATPLFQRFLDKLRAARASAGALGKIHIVAHSMGTRVVCRSLGDPSVADAALPIVANLILAAGELDRSEYDALFPKLMARSQRHSSYYHVRDRALTAAKDFHHVRARPPNPAYVPIGDRAYLRAPPPCTENVECNASELAFLGLLHGYYSTSPAVLEDLAKLIGLDRGAAQRGLKSRQEVGVTLWAVGP